MTFSLPAFLSLIHSSPTVAKQQQIFFLYCNPSLINDIFAILSSEHKTSQLSTDSEETKQTDSNVSSTATLELPFSVFNYQKFYCWKWPITFANQIKHIADGKPVVFIVFSIGTFQHDLHGIIHSLEQISTDYDIVLFGVHRSPLHSDKKDLKAVSCVSSSDKEKLNSSISNSLHQLLRIISLRWNTSLLLTDSIDKFTSMLTIIENPSIVGNIEELHSIQISKGWDSLEKIEFVDDTFPCKKLLHCPIDSFLELAQVDFINKDIEATVSSEKVRDLISEQSTPPSPSILTNIFEANSTDLPRTPTKNSCPSTPKSASSQRETISNFFQSLLSRTKQMRK